MKTFAFLLLLLLPTTAYATDYYVAVTGTSGGSGADSANAKSLAWFNQNAVAGDRAILTAGTYSDPIQPQADGTSANRIVYMGAMRAPTTAIVPNIYFGKETTTSPTVNWGNYVTVKWVKSTGTAGTVNYLRQDIGGNWYADHDDSLRKVEVNGDLVMNGTNLVFDSLNVVGTNTRIRSEPANTSYSSSNISYSYHAYNNKLAHSTVTIENTQSTGDVDFVRLKAAKNWAILQNTFQLTNSGGSNNNNYCIFFQGAAPQFLDSVDPQIVWSAPRLQARQIGQRSLVAEG